MLMIERIDEHNNESILSSKEEVKSGSDNTSNKYSPDS